ncbi:MAG TPA: exosortase/archaeosortase family protein [Tepidisphaeraceae bacterium]|nr:exosortase/archaeosortase family protein [Tepidisphaeraceae bacterium]
MTWLFFEPCLSRLWRKTNPFYGEANWGHSCFIPLVGLYYLYLNRDQILKADVKPLLGTNFTRFRFITGLCTLICGGLIYLMPRLVPDTVRGYVVGAAIGIIALGALAIMFDWGLAVLFWGLLVFVYAIGPGQNDWLKDFGMVATLFGVVLTLCGWEVMKIAWFPIAFLVCALPWPELVYSKIALPLQNLAATVAVGVLNLFGAESMQAGSKIVIQHPFRILNVAEACAGLRSLMTFIFVAATIAFLSARPLWQRILLTLSAIPIAIFCNVMRVAGQGLLDHYVSEQLSQSFAHQFVGLVMLLPAMLLILGFGWVLDQILIEEDDSPTPGVVRVPNRSAGSAPAGSEGK